MNNLIIIGNGFDLAHGLKTSYTDFINFILNNEINNANLFPDLYSYTGPPNDLGNYISLYFQRKAIGSRAINDLLKFNNHFFEQMMFHHSQNNWCDIEFLYFQLLKSTKVPKKINDEFEIVKNHLKKYLLEEQKDFKPIHSYSSMFQQLNNAKRTLVLNFNYTNCVNEYCKNNKIKVVNIHGELDNSANPIIFGYASNHEDSRLLSIKDENEYLRNIKKQCYKRTNNFNHLVSFLDATKLIDVSIYGHSCGLSDSLILNEIFNHQNINSIRTFYYENHESYFQAQINTDRIMNNDANFKKFINYGDSFRMPQKLDKDSQLIDFNMYVVKMLGNQAIEKSESIILE